jgi:hypothetical protein
MCLKAAAWISPSKAFLKGQGGMSGHDIKAAGDGTG